MGGKPGEYYLVYFGREKPTEWTFQLPAAVLSDGMEFHVDVLDTWNMTISPVDTVFTATKLSQYQFGSQGDAKVELPGREYMALKSSRLHAPKPRREASPQPMTVAVGYCVGAVVAASERSLDAGRLIGSPACGQPSSSQLIGRICNFALPLSSAS